MKGWSRWGLWETGVPAPGLALHPALPCHGSGSPGPESRLRSEAWKPHSSPLPGTGFPSRNHRGYTPSPPHPHAGLRTPGSPGAGAPSFPAPILPRLCSPAGGGAGEISSYTSSGGSFFPFTKKAPGRSLWWARDMAGNCGAPAGGRGVGGCLPWLSLHLGVLGSGPGRGSPVWRGGDEGTSTLVEAGWAWEAAQERTSLAGRAWAGLEAPSGVGAVD